MWDMRWEWDVKSEMWDEIFWAARSWERGRGGVLVSWQPHSLTPHTCLADCKVDQQFSALPPSWGHNRQNLPSSDIDQLSSSSSQNNCQVYQAGQNNTGDGRDKVSDIKISNVYLKVWNLALQMYKNRLRGTNVLMNMLWNGNLENFLIMFKPAGETLSQNSELIMTPKASSSPSQRKIQKVKIFLPFPSR